MLFVTSIALSCTLSHSETTDGPIILSCALNVGN